MCYIAFRIFDTGKFSAYLPFMEGLRCPRFAKVSKFLKYFVLSVFSVT